MISRFQVLSRLIIFLSVFLTPLAQAQVQGIQWSPLYHLSSEDRSVVNDSTSMEADVYGHLHVFWAEDGTSPDNPSTIQYTSFNGDTWLTPVDIFVVHPDSDGISNISTSGDQVGRLHLVWTEGTNGPTYYSNAPTNEAYSAHNWSSPSHIDIPAYRVQLRVDVKGVLHLLYTDFYGEQPGVYYTRSADQGQTWTDSIKLDPDIPRDYVPYEVRLEQDETGNLHALWAYHDLTDLSFPAKWIRYANSLNNGQNWSWPITIDEDDKNDNKVRAAGPLLAVYGKTVLVLWAGDSGTHRVYRFSTDAGQTWSVPIRIFGDLEGQAGDGMTVDSAGRIHYFGQIRYPQGIYHAFWSQGNWTVPSLIYLITNTASIPMGDRIHAHNVKAAIRTGNQIIVTFTNAPDERQLKLYAMYSTLDDLSPIQPVPMPSLPKLIPTSIPSPTSTALIPTLTPTRPKPELSTTPVTSSPGRAIWLGIVPSLLLIASIVAFKMLQIRFK